MPRRPVDVVEPASRVVAHLEHPGVRDYSSRASTARMRALYMYMHHGAAASLVRVVKSQEAHCSARRSRWPLRAGKGIPRPAPSPEGATTRRHQRALAVSLR